MSNRDRQNCRKMWSLRRKMGSVFAHTLCLELSRADLITQDNHATQPAREFLYITTALAIHPEPLSR